MSRVVADAPTHRGIRQPFCFPRVLFPANAGLSFTKAPKTLAQFSSPSCLL